MKRMKLFFLAFSVVFVTGCSLPVNDSKRINPEKNKPVVVTTFTVLADLAKNVAGEKLTIQSITKPGAEIHSYQFTPSDVIKASKAQLIIENGLGLELWFKRFTATAGNVPTITLSDGIKPLAIEEDKYKGKPNPHAWMSPQKAMLYVDKLVETFIEIDPLNESTYRSNGNNYKKELMNLDNELRLTLSKIPLKKRVLVSCEGAFTYLANDYGMQEAYLWPVNAESQVTPKRMANLIKTIKEKEVPTIFCESSVSSEAQKQVAIESGATFGGNLYVDSLSKSDGPAPTYLKLLRHNVQLIVNGLTSGS